MSQVDAYSALDTGVVSCNQQYIQGVIEHRQFEVTDQLILTNLGQILGFGVVMNRDTFDALPQDDQDTLLQAGDEFIDLFAEKLMKSTEEDLVKLQDASSEYHMKVTELSEADNEKLREAAEVYNANWVEQANAAGLPGNELLDTFRGLIEKYDATLKEKGYPWEAR
jgi:TRAP-type C4-dicarboxylate transport system substrate-binding protein